MKWKKKSISSIYRGLNPIQESVFKSTTGDPLQPRSQGGEVRRRQRGFTLVEALVALVILSIGLLGLATLQMNSVSATHSSMLRTQASVLAFDLSERMRVYHRSAADYVSSCDGSPGMGEMQDWCDILADRLPSPSAEVADLGDDEYLIRITWAEQRNILATTLAGDTGAREEFTYRFQPAR